MRMNASFKNTKRYDGSKIKKAPEPNVNPFYEQVMAGLLGHAVGDALGVPAEFCGREYMAQHPVVGMMPGGTHNKPSGTWSDDTSMTLALADSLSTGKLDFSDIMDRFLAWQREGAYTVDGEMFDIGITTANALSRYCEGVNLINCGGSSERDNGNGSLMRILPIAFYLEAQYGQVLCEEGVEIIKNASSLTHAHPRSVAACVIYCAVAHEIMKGYKLSAAIHEAIVNAAEYFSDEGDYSSELQNFRCMSIAGETAHYTLEDWEFYNIAREDIRSGGYVVDTLDASIWCLLHYESYKETVLVAVNLGHDTDTTAAVCGGLAGLHYSINPYDDKDIVARQIPEEWINGLANPSYLLETYKRFAKAIDPVLSAPEEVQDIAEAFAGHFVPWGLTLPVDDLRNRRRGRIWRYGWNVQYLFGSDSNGEYLEYYATHRMTNDSHVRIDQSGESTGLEALSDVMYISKEGERERLEEHDKRVAQELREKGFDVF